MIGRARAHAELMLNFVSVVNESCPEGVSCHIHFFRRPMDISSIRRNNLSLLCKQYLDGNDVAPDEIITRRFAERIGLTSDHLSALQSGSQPCDDDLARRCERQLSLPAGWLDQPHAAYPGEQDPEHRHQRRNDQGHDSAWGTDAADVGNADSSAHSANVSSSH